MNFCVQTEGNRPLGTARLRWDNSIKIDLKQVGLMRTDWIVLTEVADRRERGDELVTYIKIGKFTYLKKNKLLKNNSFPRNYLLNFFV